MANKECKHRWFEEIVDDNKGGIHVTLCTKCGVQKEKQEIPVKVPPKPEKIKLDSDYSHKLYTEIYVHNKIISSYDLYHNAIIKQKDDEKEAGYRTWKIFHKRILEDKDKEIARLQNIVDGLPSINKL